MMRAWLLLLLVLDVRSALALDITLRPSATIANAVIRLGDISDIADAELAALVVQPSPNAGRWLIDARRVRAAAVQLSDATIRGSCLAVRPHIAFDDALLRAAAMARITSATATSQRITCTASGSIAPLQVPLGASVRLLAEPLGPAGDAISGRGVVRVRVFADEIEIDRRLVPVQVERWRRVVTAARAVPRGTPLSADDVIEVDSLADARNQFAASAMHQVLGKYLSVDLAAGQIVAVRDLHAQPAVRRSTAITLRVVVGDTTAETAAVALSDGDIGTRIRVRRSHDNAIVQAQVDNIGLVTQIQ